MNFETLEVTRQNDTCYVSCGCNRSPHCVDWGYNNLICYGFANSVAIYDPKNGGGGRVIFTLKGHKDRINSVRWIRSRVPHFEFELVSVSSDKSAIVWSLKNGEFCASSVLSGHSDSVTVVDAVYSSEGVVPPYPSALVATASVDSLLKLWRRPNLQDNFECTETIDLNTGLSFTLAFVFLPGREFPLIASGNDDTKIHLFHGSEKVGCLDGHTDWVRAFDAATTDSGEVLFASASQDTTVRIWRLTTQLDKPVNINEFKQEEEFLILNGVKWRIILETILCGHEGWVYSVQWRPKIYKKEKGWTQIMEVMTSSLDRTVVTWAPNEKSGLWLETLRVGEMGGNTLGYFAARYAPLYPQLIAHSFQGAFHMWEKDGDCWKPGVTVGGHSEGVIGLSWEREGRYILSASLDQTTRLHAPWIADPPSPITWHEMCRPQVHGYDMSCITALPKFTFVSGSEEKVARAFTAPKNVLQNLATLIKLPTNEVSESDLVPYGAAVPALGLSNKAVFQEECINQEEDGQGTKHPTDEYSETPFVPQLLKKPGSEDYLVQNSLWPEVMKLYGHAYEIYSLSSSHKGDLVATSCKATTAQHAVIILWNTSNWGKVQELGGHQLTVTEMKFSPDDSHLLSVSRDRKWCLFERNDEGMYSLAERSEKNAHSRIIWSCSWSWDGAYFATGSRDTRVIVWEKGSPSSPSGAPFISAHPITQVCFAQRVDLPEGAYLLAVGSESGSIDIFAWKPNRPWEVHHTLRETSSHSLAVQKLAFRPVFGVAGECKVDDSVIQLASCSMDHTLRIHNIPIPSTR